MHIHSSCTDRSAFFINYDFLAAVATGDILFARRLPRRDALMSSRRTESPVVVKHQLPVCCVRCQCSQTRFPWSYMLGIGSHGDEPVPEAAE